MDNEKEALAEKSAQLSLGDALKEQIESDPPKLNDGTVLRWADDKDKESPSDDYRMREGLQGQRVAAKLGIKKAVEHQGISGFKAATAEDEKRAREGVANFDTRKKRPHPDPLLKGEGN